MKAVCMSLASASLTRNCLAVPIPFFTRPQLLTRF